MRTQVGIVGAGPAGLMLAHLLSLQGIELVVIETGKRAEIEHRVRAGVLEQGRLTCSTPWEPAADAAARASRIDGIVLRFRGEDHRIDLREFTGGRGITVYGQQEIVKDLIAIRLSAGHPILFDVSAVHLHDIKREHPWISFLLGGASTRIDCDVIAGCDGFHGVSRASIPTRQRTTYEREYPFAWLGILAGVAAVIRGAHLLSSRARIRAAQHALTDDEPPVPAGQSRRADRRLAGRAHLGGAGNAPRDAWVVASRRADHREGHHGDAQPRRGADAARPPLPRRRRGAHRAAHRCQGHEPRASRREVLAEALTAWFRDRDARRWIHTRHTACAGSGERSTSRGG